jgi:predicted ATP-grasp superfamily ATP-dependent carboligase
VARLPEPLASRFPASIAPRGALETLLDKGALSLLLAELGLPQPRTAVLRRPEDIDAFEPWSFADAFLKPRSSHHFMERFRVKGVRVASRAEAADRASALFRQGLDVIVQEYVPGPPSNHYFLDGFVDAAGAVRARFARKRLRMYPADFGNSTYMVSVPMDETGPAMGQLETLLRHVKYRGIFSAEFKKDARDGAFRLLEVNVRPWWYLGFAETSGIRVVDLAYRDALGLPLRDYLDYRPGRHCVYPYFDYAAYGAAKRAGAPGPSLAACAAAWLTANQPIFAWDDPGPALSSWKGLCQRLFKSHVLGQRP